ncbi:MAG: exosortase/archaeosortase family protein [Verrucomicrobiales bacterium]|nr:exosortase/archaeosortase family protein [Verrucomicrobiales bacterium]
MSNAQVQGTAVAESGGGRWRGWALAGVLALVWAWAVAGCVDEWRDNPMYSYGWFVPPLMIFFAWRRLEEPMVGRAPFEAPQGPSLPVWVAVAAFGVGLLVLPVELLRNELPDDRMNNWFVGVGAVAFTLWVARWVGGWRLVWTLAFPVALFLTAVAWPKRYEIPVTIGLQKFVATVIVEVMHLLGIHAEPHGTTIYLRNGPVGIAEACSGVRSLQASLMISLAVGELFFLRWVRRAWLVLLCAVVAMVLNLGRTLALCLITEYQGSEAMHRVHDWIGDAVLIVLPALAWGMGRLLAAWGGAVATEVPARGAAGAVRSPSNGRRLGAQVSGMDWGRIPNLAPALVIALLGMVTYHAWLAVLDWRSPPQRAPYFTVRTGPGMETKEESMSPDVWGALTPSSGGMYTRRQGGVPGGRVHLYHFFWKPAAANRWVTGHRPDVCMPAGGWKKDGDVEPLEVEFDGQRLTMHLFRFADSGQRALQVWGIWRNGEPIHMDFFQRPRLEWSVLTGKNRSAVEVLSCVVPYLDGEPPVEVARAVLRDVVRYQRDDSAPGTMARREGTGP